eukprot:IDg20868t1
MCDGDGCVCSLETLSWPDGHVQSAEEALSTRVKAGLCASVAPAATMSFVPPSARRTFDAAAADARAASRAAEQGSDAKRAPLASLRARDGAAATPAF